MGKKMNDGAEAPLKNCNNISLLQKASTPFKQHILKSLKPTDCFLLDVTCPLELKQKKFQVHESSSNEDTQAVWEWSLLIHY